MRAIVLTACLAAASLSIGAPARALNIDPVFAGTLVSTYPDGRQAHLWISRDGSYYAKNRRNKPSSGTWKVSGQKMCFKQKKPLSVPFSYCAHLPPSLATSWNDKAVTGERINVKLVAGRGAR